MGNVATHCYFELDADGLDTECAETAWNLLIQRHGMMRVIIQPDGMQRILENTPQYHIDVTDIRQLEVTEKEKALDEKRAEMSHQVIQTDEWPLFDVRITKIEDQKHRIHISFDNIIFDGWSMFHLLNEWAEVYRNGNAEMPITLSFRDYVLGLEQIKSTSAYEKDKKYWEERVETFANAPDLPLAKNESQITEQRFCRRSAKLSQKEWQSVKDAARRLEVTPSVLLMSAYAETLRLWSSNTDFTLNLTQFDRKQLHPEVNDLIGDFTTLTLLEIKNAGNSFAERTKAIQKQLTEDLEHTAYSAVELERELKKKTGNMRGAIMPVVFTSGLGVEQWNEGKWLGKLNYNISQTPQVWLDHQVVEMDGSLCLFWDSVDELFYPGMLDEMFRAYTGLLHTLAVHPEIMQEKTASLVTAKISEKRRQANETAVEFEEKTLDRLFLEAVDRLKEEFSTENIEIIQMDVFIPKQVEMFCSQCDVVINCTSPASIVGTRIVRECIKQGNDYIDPFGEGDVEKYIVDNKSMIGDKKTRIILSSGTYPGLSEALFKYVAEIHKGAEVSIKEYFYGNSYFSHGATQDVISSMINNKSKSMSFFYKDEIIPCKMRIGESICIDEKVGTMYLYPIISKDFRRVCKETGVKEGCFFNTFSDLSSMASFFEIGSKIYHSNSMDTFGYTEQLEKMYRNKSTENEKTIFWFGIELVNGNDVEKKLMSFEYACNWNSLSGYVCALVAEWCLNDEISKGKAYNLDEIEGIQKFIESLPGEIKQNIVKL